MSWINVRSVYGTNKFPKSNPIGIGDYLTAANGSTQTQYVFNDGRMSVFNDVETTVSAASSGTNAWNGFTLGYIPTSAGGNGAPFASFSIPAIPTNPTQILWSIGSNSFTSTGMVAGQTILSSLTVNGNVSIFDTSSTNVFNITSAGLIINTESSFLQPIISDFVIQGNSTSTTKFQMIRGVTNANAMLIDSATSAVTIGESANDMTLNMYGQSHFISPQSTSMFSLYNSSASQLVMNVDTTDSVIAFTNLNSITSSAQIIISGAEQLNKLQVVNDASQNVFRVDSANASIVIGDGTQSAGLTIYGPSGTPQFAFSTNATLTNSVFQTTNLLPITDYVSVPGYYNIGSNSLRYGTVYAVLGVSPGSDVRFKTNIEPITGSKARDILRKLRPIQYSWKSGGQRHSGIIAQDLIPMLNEIGAGVLTGYNPDLSLEEYLDDGPKFDPVSTPMLMIRYHELIAYLIAAVVDLENEVVKLSQN